MKKISFSIRILSNDQLTIYTSNEQEVSDEMYEDVIQDLKEKFGAASKGEMNFFSFPDQNNDIITIGKDLLVKSIFKIIVNK